MSVSWQRGQTSPALLAGISIMSAQQEHAAMVHMQLMFKQYISVHPVYRFRPEAGSELCLAQASAHRRSCGRVGNDLLMPKKLAPSSRDHFLKRQDVRNLEHTLAESTWKLHDDEATSVRLFQQRHEKNIFMYREQHPEQPDNDSQTHQPAQPFVMGLVTDGMREAALKHGHDGVVCLDATFSPNHMKFSLYTALVVDTHGNGLPIFEVLSESTTHPAVTEWMVAFQRYMHTFQADWRPSCFMVDDAGCERNKARKIAEESSAIAA
jgi:hypothetical protein